ncbi:hypothetical protein AVEN_5293-1 [Araneus ventricosus]|uniref:Uncharacterized protein n=1 Tax=Araneus ventricosus TaxID=182803 RepID=A0A4Y2CXA6_ARAVE|nr:hypothetical protein AVEN_5293-1 [Araneus ventricosus]
MERCRYQASTVSKIVIIDNKLNWAPHLLNIKTKATILTQNLNRITGSTWGLKKEFRRRLYSTVPERMILHGVPSETTPFQLGNQES